MLDIFRDGAFVATILCDAREEEMEENMEQVGTTLHKNRILYQTCPKPKKTDDMRMLPAEITKGNW
jgi:hypothetical protein